LYYCVDILRCVLDGNTPI